MYFYVYIKNEISGRKQVRKPLVLHSKTRKTISIFSSASDLSPNVKGMNYKVMRWKFIFDEGYIEVS